MDYQPTPISYKKDLDRLRGDHPELTIVDSYRDNLEELFLLRNPKFRFEKEYQKEFENFIADHTQGNELSERGSWFYFSWLNRLVHFLDEDLHYELRTGRNKYLILEKEQSRFYNSTIGILGMSVGSHIALTIAMTGGAKHLKIADPDKLSGDNLNRIRLGFSDVGTPKVILVARQIAEVNPYATISIFEDGITHKNAEAFFEGLDLLVEEMDNPFWKFKSREMARSLGIPVLMGTDNGDGCIVDIERYDIDKKYPLFHGLVSGLTSDSLKDMSPEELPKIAARIAGANLAVPRMLESVPEVGKSIYSWPQLGTAANLCGSAIAYLARRILNRDSLIQSGRYQVNLDAIFESNYSSILSRIKRKIGFLKFIKKMKNG